MLKQNKKDDDDDEETTTIHCTLSAIYFIGFDYVCIVRACMHARIRSIRLPSLLHSWPWRVLVKNIHKHTHRHPHSEVAIYAYIGLFRAELYTQQQQCQQIERRCTYQVKKNDHSVICVLQLRAVKTQIEIQH